MVKFRAEQKIIFGAVVSFFYHSVLKKMLDAGAVLLSDPGKHLNQLVPAGRRPVSISTARSLLVLPCTVNILLIVSNLLAGWGALASQPLLLTPWLLAYLAYILFAFGLLLYLVIVLTQIWFKIVLFLLVCPVLLLCIVFWLTLLELYFNLRQTKTQSAPAPPVAPPPPQFTRHRGPPAARPARPAPRGLNSRWRRLQREQAAAAGRGRGLGREPGVEEEVAGGEEEPQYQEAGQLPGLEEEEPHYQGCHVL